MLNRASTFDAIQRRVVACRRCPELRAYCARVAEEKRRAYLDWTYWGRPVPALGESTSRLLMVGLAPGAHGSNRTGRMFTGDASGEWLFRALFRAGFVNRAEAHDRDDGLVMQDAVITAAVRCAPPQNKPTPAQIARCAPFLDEELKVLSRLRVVVGLGAVGTRAAFDALVRAGFEFSERPAFAHGAEVTATERRGAQRSVVLIASYHPSRQNTNTRKLTEPMLDAIFARARALIGAP